MDRFDLATDFLRDGAVVVDLLVGFAAALAGPFRGDLAGFLAPASPDARVAPFVDAVLAMTDPRHELV